MKMDIILSKWCLAILFALGILACTDGSDANELPKEPEGTGETQDEKIPAFPGAEGHGRYTTGGRGGDVYIVTSLEDKLQNGTLRYGIEKLSGKRTIIFQVSGTIHLNGDLKIKNGDLTIAGQTAPGMVFVWLAIRFSWKQTMLLSVLCVFEWEIKKMSVQTEPTPLAAGIIKI